MFKYHPKQEENLLHLIQILLQKVQAALCYLGVAKEFEHPQGFRLLQVFKDLTMNLMKHK